MALFRGISFGETEFISLGGCEADRRLIRQLLSLRTHQNQEALQNGRSTAEMYDALKKILQGFSRECRMNPRLSLLDGRHVLERCQDGSS